MQGTVLDAFSGILGMSRGSEREGEDEEIISVEKRQRHILALIAAYGILGHNTAVSMPGSFSAPRIESLLVHGGNPNKPSAEKPSEELYEDLAALTAAGFLRSYQESWRVTPAGLVALWSGVER